jgi:hypothetical protein
MSLTITGEAEMTFPQPQHELVTEHVRALIDGEPAVHTAAVAHGVNRHNTESLPSHLRNAEGLGLIVRGVGASRFPVERTTTHDAGLRHRITGRLERRYE